jgi:GH15 family glucan-1,4-alpha-glucosidase
MGRPTEPARPAETGQRADGRYLPIRDYAAIGDCHSAALVSQNGDVDWCCLGRFDAEPVFCRILDADRGGFLSVRPADRFSTSRAYLDGTNILRTGFSTGGGSITVTDFMPVGRRPGAGTHDYVHLQAPGWFVRIIEGVDGTVPLRIRYRPSLAFARRPAVIQTASDRLTAEDGLCLHHDGLGFSVDGDTACANVEMKAGQRHALVLAPASTASHLTGRVDRLLDVTTAFWREWIGYCRYGGPYKDAVRRSALALKLLAYAPTGAIAAAPTTSLPEEIGGARNWDYRYCWLRDAAFTLYALAALGYGGEARRFSTYLPQVCATTYPDLQIMYGIGGEPDLAEQTLDHLDGYMQSRPVRTGNGAYTQRQIDVYGEVLDWAHLFQTLGGRFDRGAKKMLSTLADHVAAHWQDADQGLWEMRGPARHHVHGKMMSWVALDRAIRVLGPRPLWEEQRQRILDDIRTRGVSASGGHLLQAYDHEGTDAALLLAPVVAFPIDRAALEATVAAVERELRHGDFVYRYKCEDGLEGSEGAFLICSFWLADALLHLGRHGEAKALFERLLEHANGVGLYAEEIDPETGSFLGNFPQAFTHLALIGAAVHLDLYERYGPSALVGNHADRARFGVGATLGWRALWAAFKATRRVGRILPSRRSVLRKAAFE